MILLQLASPPRWQRFAGPREIASGSGWPAAAAASEPEPVLVAVPGEAVALHWLDLPDLAPAQASAAARLMLGDRLAEADPHVVVAPMPPGGSRLRPVAVVARAAMAGWLADLAAHGLTAAAIVPEPLLLPEPASGWSVMADGPRVIARSATAAFAAEADLAALLLGDAARQPARLGLPDQVPLNLLAGDFAPVRRWRAPPGLARRAGLAVAALLGLWLAGDLAALWRASRAARAADAETLAVARPLLAAGAADGAAALAGLQAIARQHGADGGLAALAGPLTSALATRPANSAGLASLRYTPAGGLVAGVAGGEAEAVALAEAMRATGLGVQTGLTRADADGSITDVTVRRPEGPPQ
jgi:general secretion pathway protein L